ncbi:hypothetical protein SAMN02800691_2688 [Luteibacter sp. UNCMF366Tsu5.1]|nr:hypothetical protein SAMN02800691_2688 [Luteibacter sp. UNCMF366Tsu5.1]
MAPLFSDLLSPCTKQVIAKPATEAVAVINPVVLAQPYPAQ